VSDLCNSSPHEYFWRLDDAKKGRLSEANDMTEEKKLLDYEVDSGYIE
jgi:hypothetical protein